ncbi:ABC transporter permease subunit [Peptostreptococcus porci]|uniref:ABC transporter permease subunit n=1 Tax=Peptostreptococcus porci TaxID=2652282 RepID=UPI002A9126C9|nr:ABC transporter permease subunit [Peptostreptococcus porci]MDY5437013.1 ABC transporter permease subunit [Peptostreptococcus porci]
MESFADMGNYITYFGMIFGIILIAVSVFASLFSSRILLDEEKGKSIEFLAAREVNRTEIYLAKYITAFIAVLLVVCFSSVVALICGLIGGGDTFDFIEYVRIIKISSITPFFFLTLSISLAGASFKFGNAMVSGLILMSSYMLGYLSKLLGENGEWLKYFSTFELFSSSKVVELERETIVWYGVYFIISVILVVVGGYFYNKRDYKI